jgi:hypothetical protein
MAEVEPALAHGVADRPVIARQLNPRLHIHGGHIVAEGDPERARVRCVGMVEMPAIVPAQHPQVQLGVERGVGPQKALKLFGHLPQLSVGEDAIDAAVKPPNEVACADPFSDEHPDAMDGARTQFGFDHHHRHAPTVRTCAQRIRRRKAARQRRACCLAAGGSHGSTGAASPAGKAKQ